MCLPYVSSNIFRLDDHESWSFEGYWKLMLYQPCDPMRRCGSFLMTPGWSYVSFGAVACHAKNQLWWSNVLRQGNLRIPPIWGSFQREKSFCNLSKHERLFMDCEPAPMVCDDWWSQAWPCLSGFLPGQIQAQPDFQMWSAMENLPPGSPTPVWHPMTGNGRLQRLSLSARRKETGRSLGSMTHARFQLSFDFETLSRSHVKPDAPLERQVLEKALMCMVNVFKKVSILMTSLKNDKFTSVWRIQAQLISVMSLIEKL